jgi:hypothetical protein
VTFTDAGRALRDPGTATSPVGPRGGHRRGARPERSGEPGHDDAGHPGGEHLADQLQRYDLRHGQPDADINGFA